MPEISSKDRGNKQQILSVAPGIILRILSLGPEKENQFRQLIQKKENKYRILSKEDGRKREFRLIFLICTVVIILNLIN